MEKHTVLIDNEHGRITLENGILVATWKVSFIDLKTAKNAIYDRQKATNGKAYPLLVKLGAIRDSTKEARDFMASEEACVGLIAGAICVNSSLENMIGNLFIYLNKPKIPTKIFKDESKAREWLSRFVEKK